jgi:hypothetical protein
VQLQDDYFAAYRSLKVTRDASGVLVVEFHSNGGPFTFTAQDQPLKERIVREVGYGLSLEGASAADLVKSMSAQNESVAQKGEIASKATESVSSAQVIKKTQPEEFDLVILGGGTFSQHRAAQPFDWRVRIAVIASGRTLCSNRRLIPSVRLHSERLLIL